MISFDCHAHVYPDTRAVTGARYRPSSPAPLSEWKKLLRQNGLRGGVLVQPSFLGADNTVLLQALSELDESSFRGVAVAGMDVSRTALANWYKSGIRGLRWNLVHGAQLPDLSEVATRTFLRNLRDNGMHIEVHLESARLGKFLPNLLQLADNVVVDHFGLPSTPDDEIWFSDLKELSERVWIKFSAPYRSGLGNFGVRYAERLVEVFGHNRLIWGSDWPWTRFEGLHAYQDTISWGNAWQDAGIDFDANAHILYGL